MVEHVIHLDAEIGVHRARALADALLDALARSSVGDHLVLDCTAVRSLDTAIGQLLVAFLIEAESTGIPVRVRGAKASTLFQAALGCDQLDGKTAHRVEKLAGSDGRGAP